MGDRAGDAGDGRRIEELLRVNAELAAEIRSLSLGRTSAARAAAAPAARRIVRVVAERDSLAAELEQARLRLEQLEAHNQELGRQIHERAQEIEQLRGGFGGWLRRLRARLLRRDA